MGWSGMLGGQLVVIFGCCSGGARGQKVGIVSVLLNLSCTSETVVGRFLHPVASKVCVRGSPVFLSPPQPETTLIRVLQSDFQQAKHGFDLQ